jgi:hypothetical protein
MTKMPPDETDAEQKHRLWWGVHRVEPQQVEPVLVEVIGHLCRLCADTTAEANRLSHALSSRRG